MNEDVWKGLFHPRKALPGAQHSLEVCCCCVPGTGGHSSGHDLPRPRRAHAAPTPRPREPERPPHVWRGTREFLAEPPWGYPACLKVKQRTKGRDRIAKFPHPFLGCFLGVLTEFSVVKENEETSGFCPQLLEHTYFVPAGSLQSCDREGASEIQITWLSREMLLAARCHVIAINRSMRSLRKPGNEAWNLISNPALFFPSTSPSRRLV